jgi:catechol 2,3-dioxygenase-like lactoylglutathione lyase family enzyme
VLADAEEAAIVPVADIDRAIEFYGSVLGLEMQARREDLPENREAEFRAANGTLLAYESAGAGQSRHTVAGFLVDDVEQAVDELRRRGLAFEEYDTPNLKTENAIATIGPERAAWFKDPDGNILTVFQIVK